MDERTGGRPAMGAPVAQGFGTLGLQVAVRHQALASSRRETTFPIFWRTKKTKRTERSGLDVSDHDVSTGFDAGAVSVPEPKMPLPTETRRPLDLADRPVYSRIAERYWILRSGDDELRFTHRSAAEHWATRLAERGISPELTWHDENIASSPRVDRSVA
jgi:hypothetical protein